MVSQPKALHLEDAFIQSGLQPRFSMAMKHGLLVPEVRDALGRLHKPVHDSSHEVAWTIHKSIKWFDDEGFPSTRPVRLRKHSTQFVKDKTRFTFF